MRRGRQRTIGTGTNKKNTKNAIREQMTWCGEEVVQRGTRPTFA
jgi:hypothetical protein